MNNNDIKPRLKAFLQSRQGRDMAITRNELRNILGLDIKQDRQLRLLIAELRSEGFPVFPATQDPAGYYMPSTNKELQEGLVTLRNYIVSLCVQRAKIKKAGELSLYSGKQGVLI